MQHLNDEELARLVDEQADEDEATHLTLCDLCASELDALRGQTRALAELPDLTPPASLQPRLHAAMALEGLFLSNHSRRRSLLRIAASLALFVSGGLAGFLGRGAVVPAGEVAMEAPRPTNVTEAAQQLQAAEAAYSAALAAYSSSAGTPSAADPVNRLAALEGIVLTTRAALNDAPADPVINGYHLTALEQRDEILRQLVEAEATPGDNEQEWY